MLKNNKSWLSKLMAWWLGTSFAAKADEISTGSTKFWAGIATFFGAFSVNEWGVIFGIFLGFASFLLSWYFKLKNHHLLRDRVEQDLMKELSQ